MTKGPPEIAEDEPSTLMLMQENGEQDQSCPLHTALANELGKAVRPFCLRGVRAML